MELICLGQIDVSLPFDQLQALYPRAMPLLAETGMITRRHRIYSVVVQPGDVLYVPPMWLHHVVTIQGEPAISVNAFYPSRVQSLMDRINSAPIPFEVTFADLRSVRPSVHVSPNPHARFCLIWLWSIGELGPRHTEGCSGAVHLPDHRAVPR
jgi:hypothetical protein